MVKRPKLNSKISEKWDNLVLMLKMIINNDENEDLGKEKIVLTLITPHALHIKVKSIK